MPKIPPPKGNLSEHADHYTSLQPDYTAQKAENRVLHINFGFIKYGTNDKSHAAALILSLLLLAIIIFLMVVGMFSSNTVWLEKIFTWLGSAFLFISGVAIGRGSRHHSEPRDDDG